jgi:hypothetical protein
MILFAQPAPFLQAAQFREIQSILPTTLSSAELNGIAADILERAFFSARVSNAEQLQRLSDVIDSYIAGETDIATARLEIKNFLTSIAYSPQPNEQGTIKDLSSDARINLQLEMNASFARGYGNWLQGQQPAILDRWPAQELYRAFNRQTHRQWSGQDNQEIIKGEPEEGRWVAAGGQVFSGRMIALKNTQIWTEISRFGLPYPPFDFNSGMSIRDIDRGTAIQLGLIDRDTIITPETRNFNQDLQSTADIRNAALRQELEYAGYRFDGNVLTP